ncbi:HvfC/BufC N-terminal domain-containing protein [Achromobacter marplatensis]|uniref:HvfC/BufC N-terminal domain-containing protein n=1 Tax=Achromobacter marplatensis TaxID=470868 RepID=UPI0039F71BDB
MPALHKCQQTFAQALLDVRHGVPEGVVDPEGQQTHHRFSVCRNNVFTSLIDALRAGFPCVEKLVGSEFFGAMARIFVTLSPPRSPVLLHYGAEFPDFIATFRPAASLPYLADVARIERAGTEAYHAPDAPALAPSALAAVPIGESPALRLRLHPSVRLLRSSFPACTIWRMNAPGGHPKPVDLSDGEATLVLRPEAEVQVRQVALATHHFIAALGQDLTLSQAAAIAIAEDPQFDLAAPLQALVEIGAFAGFAPNISEDRHA